MTKKREYLICVHIAFFFDGNLKKFKILKRVCKSFLKLSKKTKIYIHTNFFFKKKIFLIKE